MLDINVVLARQPWPGDAASFHQALILGRNDFEDAVQGAATRRAGADCELTRSGMDFRGAPVDTRTRAVVLALL